jgi:hypothetical protein
VERICSGIREFGFKIPVLARTDGEIVDGHLRPEAACKLGSWPGGGTTGPYDPLRRMGAAACKRHSA